LFLLVEQLSSLRSGRCFLLVEQLIRLWRAVLHARTAPVMNSSPKHVSAEARPTGRRTKCAPAERSRQAACVSGVNSNHPVSQQSSPCWMGGQGMVPYEQKTQQSPGFGRKTSPHPLQS